MTSLDHVIRGPAVKTPTQRHSLRALAPNIFQFYKMADPSPHFLPFSPSWPALTPLHWLPSSFHGLSLPLPSSVHVSQALGWQAKGVGFLPRPPLAAFGEKKVRSTPLLDCLGADRWVGACQMIVQDFFHVSISVIELNNLESLYLESWLISYEFFNLDGLDLVCFQCKNCNFLYRSPIVLFL